MITNLACTLAVLEKHREARAWTDLAVASELLAQLGLDPNAEAAHTTLVVDPVAVTADQAAPAGGAPAPAEPTDAQPLEPTTGLAPYQSVKKVLAGEIAEVVEAGCYVLDANGDSVLRRFQPGMTARYTPVAGDWWIVYPDGYQSISPKAAFEEGYMPIEAPKTRRTKEK